MQKTGIRFLRVSSFYSSMFDDYFQTHARRETASLDELQESFFQQCYGQANFHELGLQQLGYTTKNIVPGLDDAVLAQEGATSGTSQGIIDQIRKFGPDVLYIENVFQFSAAELQQIRTEVPRLRVLAGFLSSAFNANTIELLRNYDFIVTCCPGFQQEFRRAGLSTVLIMHAFSPSVLGKLQPPSWPRKTELSFVGGLIAGEQFHSARIEMLEHMVRSGVGVKVFGSIETGTTHLGPLIRPLQVLARLWQFKAVRDLHEMPMLLKRAQNWVPRERVILSSALEAGISPPVYGLRMYQTLADSLITLNSTIRSSRYIANMRIFEATGVGACVLSDHKDNLSELFEVDREIVAYASNEECAAKALWLKHNPDAAKAIAIRGQERCLRDHTYAQRTPLLDRAIRERL